MTRHLGFDYRRFAAVLRPELLEQLPIRQLPGSQRLLLPEEPAAHQDNHNQRPGRREDSRVTTNELPAEIQAEIDTETEAILAAKDDGRRITHSGKLEKATFETPDGGESVWTYRLTDTTAYLCNTPLCTDDVEYGDVVVLEGRHGPDKLRVIVGSVEVED